MPLCQEKCKGKVYIALYIDDNLMVGNIKAINGAITALKDNGVVLKVMEEIHDFLSHEIKFSKDKKRALSGQPHLIKNMDNKCDKHVHDVCSHETPGMPKFLIIKPMVDSEKISMESQHEYWLDIGMLLFL